MNLSGSLLAYLDPGTGATLMQLVLAGTAGIAAAAKMKFRRGKTVASNPDGHDQKLAAESPAATEEPDPAA